MKPSRQEEAFDFVTKTFIKLLEQDKRIAYEHKRSVIAFYEDLFAHEGIRNNMVQAFSNLLWDTEASVEKGIMYELVQVVKMIPKVAKADDPNTKAIEAMMLELIAEVGDLKEVGGGDEDDTPLI